MITEMLDGNFGPIPSHGNIAADLVPDAMRGMKEAWNTWAKSAVSELDRVLSQMHTYGTSLVKALQPKHTEDEGVRDGFAQCVRNFADVAELRSALSRMKASSTGGLCGVTREHFSNAPDHVLEWVLELTQDPKRQQCQKGNSAKKAAVPKRQQCQTMPTRQEAEKLPEPPGRPA
jgi:hypothetical protein